MNEREATDGELAGTGISRPLSDNVNLLGTLLGRAITERAGKGVLELVEELRLLCKEAAATGDDALRQQAETRIRELDDASIAWLLRAYDAFFHLVNQAEKHEIQRINRDRSRQSSAPRPESIGDAVAKLKAEGRTLVEVAALFEQLDVQPTFTAHPTEARRRAILDKQKRIAQLLDALRNPQSTSDEADDAEKALYDQIALLLATDEIRAERPTVRDEVEQGLYFLTGAVWDTAPLIRHDVQRALERHYGMSPDDDLPVFLRWRSWIGSDRDGNPNVTAEITQWTLDRHRAAALQRYVSELVLLRDELSISEQQVETPAPLRTALEETSGMQAGDESEYRSEPYRRLITRLIATIAAGADGYTAARLRSHLDVMHESLVASGFAHVAHNGQLARLRTLVRTFGFHLVTMDVRQHSRVHEQAVAALLAAAGVCDDYAALDEAAKLEVLEAELRNPRPLLQRDATLSDEANVALDSFAVIRTALARDPASIGSYIVSMTKSVSDLLEPMLLAKEAGAWRMHDGYVETQLDFVPLFETIEDLEGAPTRMAALFTHDIYRMQIRARDSFQEIMLGYSDSNKDGGYWMANWALHRAQSQLGELCRQHDVAFRLFHGRGGSVGRGGGRANLAITAMPDVVHNGRIRVTEQGEVISFRYALKELAHRHTEQLVSATLLALDRSRHGAAAPPRDATDNALMDGIATASMHAYRQLIDEPTFWDWFIRITPIEQISRLPIASRPVSRTGGTVDFEGLRAIPWVFSWTQTRYLVPGWFGAGNALQRLLQDDAAAGRLRALYHDWPFFRLLVDNAQREMARARLEIAARYARLATDTVHHQRIAREFDAASAALADITSRNSLHGFSDVIQKSINLRNPYTDVLNLLQIELLDRTRNAPADRAESLRQLLFLSINGIAAAMQSTG